MRKITFFNLLILSVLLAGCGKDEVNEPTPEPVAPYELRLDPPWARFESDLFERALEEGDMSVFSKTILISGGTGPYRIVSAKEIYSLHQGKYDISMKMTDLLKVTTECIPGQQDRIIVELLRPDILLVFPPEFTVYDKNGGCAKFTVEDRDIIVGP